MTPTKDGFEEVRGKDSHGPLQAEFQNMRTLAKMLDEYFNPGGKGGVVFTLLAAKSGDMQGGRVNYISNGDRAEMIEMLEEWLGRVKGEPVKKPGVEGDCLESPPRLLPEDK
jgi:hypothetical protein